MSAGTTPCEALIWPLGIHCCETPTRSYRRACVHEHIREAWLCDGHGYSDDGLCRPCFEADGHECPIVLVPIAEVTQ